MALLKKNLKEPRDAEMATQISMENSFPTLREFLKESPLDAETLSIFMSLTVKEDHRALEAFLNEKCKEPSGMEYEFHPDTLEFLRKIEAFLKARSLEVPRNEKPKEEPNKLVYRASSESSGPAALYAIKGVALVEMIRKGVPATTLEQLSSTMAISKERLCDMLRLPRSSVDRKIRTNELLSPEFSERVIGLERLIGQAEQMVKESGDTENFVPARWVGEWLQRSLPALGGEQPAVLLDTMEGQELVSRLLAQSQSGAYA